MGMRPTTHPVPLASWIRLALALLAIGLAQAPVAAQGTPARNRVLALDGAAGSVSVPHSADLTPTTAITLEGWVFPQAKPDGSGAFVFNKGDGLSGDTARSYELAWVAKEDVSGPGQSMRFILFMTDVTPGNPDWLFISAPVAENTWVHVAGTFSTSDRMMRLYTNGVLASMHGPISGTLRPSSLPLRIGRNEDPSRHTWKGQLDELRIWNRARSGDEIAQRMFCRLRGNEEGLAAYWNFDGGTPMDLTGRGNHGTLEGSAKVMELAGNDVVHAGPCVSGASGIAQVVNGFVVGVTVTDEGSGYPNAPVVTFSDGGGSGATATATLLDGRVTAISITNPGRGYTSTPTVHIAPPPLPPRRATATSEVVNGFVVGVMLSDGGQGYDTAPAVLLVGGGGSGATAVATVLNGVVTGVAVTNPGTGYITAPKVRLASPPFSPRLVIGVSKVKVTLSVVLGLRYQLAASSDLVTWTPAGPAFFAEDESLVREFDADAVGRYFRIQTAP